MPWKSNRPILLLLSFRPPISRRYICQFDEHNQIPNRNQRDHKPQKEMALLPNLEVFISAVSDNLHCLPITHQQVHDSSFSCVSSNELFDLRAASTRARLSDVVISGVGLLGGTSHSELQYPTALHREQIFVAGLPHDGHA